MGVLPLLARATGRPLPESLSTSGSGRPFPSKEDGCAQGTHEGEFPAVRCIATINTFEDSISVRARSMTPAGGLLGYGFSPDSVVLETELRQGDLIDHKACQDCIEGLEIGVGHHNNLQDHQDLRSRRLGRQHHKYGVSSITVGP